MQSLAELSAGGDRASGRGSYDIGDFGDTRSWYRQVIGMTTGKAVDSSMGEASGPAPMPAPVSFMPAPPPGPMQAPVRFLPAPMPAPTPVPTRAQTNRTLTARVQFLPAPVRSLPAPMPSPTPVPTRAIKYRTSYITSPTGTTTTTTFFFSNSDWTLLADWKKRVPFQGDGLPRVLMYTWCTEDTFVKFQNENYWKSCYAHVHGFDIVFSKRKNFSGVKVWKGEDTKLGRWYNEENMWAWWWDIKNYLFSGQYDYLFLMGGDTLLQSNWMWWPVWLWDRGHDITVMDQHSMPVGERYGLNENNVLWKPTQLAKDFVEEGFEFRRQFNLQGENGPYMETILRFLGRASELENRTGYSGECEQWLEIPKPSPFVMATTWWEQRNGQYDSCFFQNLNRLVGGYGVRQSVGIGFYPTFIFAEGRVLLPQDLPLKGRRPTVEPNHPHHDLWPWGPWANCWSSVRMHWVNPHINCFAYHFNGPKDMSEHNKVSGTCPDPSFDWSASPYNPANRPGTKESMKRKLGKQSAKHRS